MSLRPPNRPAWTAGRLGGRLARVLATLIFAAVAGGSGGPTPELASHHRLRACIIPPAAVPAPVLQLALDPAGAANDASGKSADASPRLRRLAWAALLARPADHVEQQGARPRPWGHAAGALAVV